MPIINDPGMNGAYKIFFTENKPCDEQPPPYEEVVGKSAESPIIKNYVHKH